MSVKINPIEFLPSDIIIEIFSHLSDNDLALRTLLVCKNWLNFVRNNKFDDQLWRRKTIKLIEREIVHQFHSTYLNWRVVYFNFKKMSKMGKVLSPTKFELSDGKFWNGKLCKGKLTSPAEIIYTSVTKLKEDFNRDLEREFTVKVNLNGYFSEGKFNGNGKFVFPDGEIQEGNFKNNRLEGQGKKTFSGGIVWEGEFKDGKMHGFGKKRDEKGTVYEQGKYNNGLLNSNVLTKYFYNET